MLNAYIYDAVRTPRGKNRGGALRGTKAVDLVVPLINAIVARNPVLDPHSINDVVLGVVTPIGEQGSVIARTAALLSGLPHTVPGVQVNRFCGSGLEAVNLAAQKVAAGCEEWVLAGGVESMTRVAMGSDGGAISHDAATAYDLHFVPQGIAADLIATIEGFTREQLDAYALRSQARAATAWTEQRFARSIIPIHDQNGVLILDTDEHRRADATAESLSVLSPSFAKLGEQAGFDAVALQKYHTVPTIQHVHTAGNSSGIVDGASLLLVGSQAAGKAAGLTPRARVVATAVVGSDPTIMLTGPIPATQEVLRRAGLNISDIDLFEVNEAFAAVVLKWQRDLGIPDEKVNVNGGAIALGHPLGATGGMILGTLLDELERQNLRLGLATLCIGSGMGIATIIERC